jgi:hypothetical protein
VSYIAQWPEHIQRAFTNTWIHDHAYANIIDSFIEHWGSLDTQAFIRAIRNGEGRERLFAMFALAEQPKPGIEEVYFPFLNSSSQEERWTSLICLGRLKDERVFPALLQLLLEAHQMYFWRPVYDDDSLWFHRQHCNLIRLLGAWGKEQVVPALRQTLHTVWQCEHQPGPFDGRWGCRWDDLHVLEDHLAYALGALEAWGALTDLQLDTKHRNWIIHYMILGHLQVPLDRWTNALWYAVDTYPSFVSIEEGKHIKRILTQRFGLTEEEQAAFFAQVANILTERDDPEEMHFINRSFP